MASTKGALPKLINRLIPADDFPSAWEAGAADFLDRLSAGPLPDLPARLERGLELLDSASQAKYGRAFEALGDAEADALIAEGEDAGGELGNFIKLMVEVSSHGYYADPEAGGNRGGKSWEMLGYRRGR